jgi:hypothetical protein
MYNYNQVKENAKKFIEEVKLLSFTERRYKNKSRAQSHQLTFFYSGFRNEKALRQGLYEVKVTDEKYFRHLQQGMVWQTTSFDICKGDSGIPFISLIDDENEPKPTKQQKKITKTVRTKAKRDTAKPSSWKKPNGNAKTTRMDGADEAPKKRLKGSDKTNDVDKLLQGNKMNQDKTSKKRVDVGEPQETKKKLKAPAPPKETSAK